MKVAAYKLSISTAKRKHGDWKHTCIIMPLGKISSHYLHRSWLFDEDLHNCVECSRNMKCAHVTVDNVLKTHVLTVHIEVHPGGNFGFSLICDRKNKCFWALICTEKEHRHRDGKHRKKKKTIQWRLILYGTEQNVHHHELFISSSLSVV